MDMAETDADSGNVLRNPLCHLIHFVKGSTTIGKSTSDLVDQHGPSKPSVKERLGEEAFHEI